MKRIAKTFTSYKIKCKEKAEMKGITDFKFGADMWAVLWNLWKRNRKTEIIDELDFTQATNNVNDWGKKAIFHNAGVNNNQNGEFHKAMFLGKKPQDLEINQIPTTFKYYELVKQIL